MEAFASLVKELGDSQGYDLELDAKGCCRLQLKENLYLQLESEKTRGEEIIMLMSLGEIEAGPFRQQVFQRAMHANSRPAPRYGIFAYSEVTRELVFFDRLMIQGLQTDYLVVYLEQFIHRGLKWHRALEQNELPVFIGSENDNPKGPNPFGL